MTSAEVGAGAIVSKEAALALPVAAIGFLLPMEFVGLVDGYLTYLHPRELISVYAWGFFFYLLVASAGAIAAGTLAYLIARVCGLPTRYWTCRILVWLSVATCLVVFTKDAQVWAGRVLPALPIRALWWYVAALILALCAFSTAVSDRLTRLVRGPVVFMAITGLGVVLLAAVLAVLPSRASDVPLRAAGAPPIRPDFILITIDTLSAQHMSLYGYGRDTTPQIDRLGKGAHVFERFYANSNFTTPTINSLLTGARPWRHRALQLEATPVASIARGGLVAQLKSAGYYTVAVSTNDAAAPFHNGNGEFFDQVLGGRTDAPFARLWARLHANYPLSYNARKLPLLVRLNKIAERVQLLLGIASMNAPMDPELALSSARFLIERRPHDRPLFIWIHLLPPHDPYVTPPPFVGHFDNAAAARTRFDSTPPWFFEAGKDASFPGVFVGRYDEAIRYLDFHVGTFVGWLQSIGMFQNSLLVVTADHGESFSHEYGGHSGPLLHEELIRIPLLIREPQQSDATRVVSIAEQVDLLPTIVDLLGMPPTGVSDGRSLLPALRGESMEGAIFSMNFEQSNRFGELHTGSVAVVEGRWKYVHFLGRPNYATMPELKDALYDLLADPAELDNRIDHDPVVATRMLSLIQDRMQRHGGPLQ